MLTFLAAAAVACNTLSMDAPRSYPIGQPTPFVFAADFNGDGRLDVGTSNEHAFAIRYGTGGGNLSEPVTFATSGFVVAVGNVVGDALPDLIDSPHVVRENRGGREFPVAVTSNDLRARPLLADFTGDGRAELVVADPFFSGVLTVNNGTVQQLSTLSLGEFTRDLQAADFNGDGKLDILAHHVLHADYRIYHGDGRGNFSLVSVVRPRPELFSVRVADLDGDGRADLAGGAYDDGVPLGAAIRYANGDVETLPGPERSPAGPLMPFDFDNDGDLDLPVQFFTDYNSTIQIYRNDQGTLVRLPTSFSVTSPLHFADFTGDAIPDLLVSGFQGIGIVKGNGDGTFRVPARLDLPPAYSPFAVDLDGNGLDELIFYSASGVTVGRPDGFGGFTRELLPFVNGTVIAAAHNEIAVGNTFTGTISLFTRGAEGWALARTFDGPPMDDIALGDFTGDGRNELATVVNVAEARSLRVRETSSGRVLLDRALPPEQYQYDVLTYGNQLILTLSGTVHVTPGDPPLVDIENDGSVIVFSFSATGTPTERVALANEAFTRTVAGDFNGDGRVDVLSSGTLAFSRPNGTFGPPQIFEDDRFRHDRVAGDLNGDGATDLVTKTAAGFTYWLGSPAGLQRAATDWISGTQSPLIARLRVAQPASILFGSPELTEVRVECVKPQGRRRGVRH